MSADYVFALAGWYFLPNLATGWLQSIYYGVTIRAGEPHPQPGSPHFIKHRRYIYSLVIVAYLVFTVYQTDWQLRRAGDFYTDLGVSIDTDEKTLSRVLRRVLAQKHPDKHPPESRFAAEQAFIHTRKAHDTLVDPAKRFAYDRFGPDTLKWQDCKTIQDYVLQGAQNSALTLLGTLVIMVIAQTLGMMSHGKYWRYLTLALLLVFEAHTITRPTFPTIISKLINPFFAFTALHPPYLPFQIIQIARQTAFSFFIAVNHLAPTWNTDPMAQQNSKEAQQQLLNQLRRVSGMANQDSQRLLALEHAPFAHDERQEAALRERLMAWLVQNEVRNDAGVSAAMRRVIERRNVEGGAGDD